MQSFFAGSDPAACGGSGGGNNGLKDLASRIDRPSIAGSSAAAGGSSSRIAPSVAGGASSFRLAPTGAIGGFAIIGGNSNGSSSSSSHSTKYAIIGSGPAVATASAIPPQAQSRPIVRGPYYSQQQQQQQYGQTAYHQQYYNAEAGPSRYTGGGASAASIPNAASGGSSNNASRLHGASKQVTSATGGSSSSSSSWSREYESSSRSSQPQPHNQALNQGGDVAHRQSAGREIPGTAATASAYQQQQQQQHHHLVIPPQQALLRHSTTTAYPPSSSVPFFAAGSPSSHPLMLGGGGGQYRAGNTSSHASPAFHQHQQHQQSQGASAVVDWDAEFARLEVDHHGNGSGRERNQISETNEAMATDAWEQSAYAQDSGLPLSPSDRAAFLAAAAAQSSRQQQQPHKIASASGVGSMTSSARASWEAERRTGMGCSPAFSTTDSSADADADLLRFAIPSVALPTFNADGRLEAMAAADGGGAEALSRAEGGSAVASQWEATFERPGSLWAQKERQDRLQEQHAQPRGPSDKNDDDTCLVSGDGEATEVDASLDALDDNDFDFDNDTLAGFYGQTHVAAPRPLGDLERRARDALEFSDSRFDLARIEDSRIEGYPLFRQARHGQVAFASDTDETQRTGRYLFQPKNPYAMGRERAEADSDVDLGQYGLEYLNVLQHEAAVLARPSDSSAWLSLGLKQQENERDDMAAQALLQCVGLDPMCGQAYLALSVSYTNEGRLREAHDVLERWVDVVNGRPPRDATSNNAMAEQGLGSGLDAATELPITRDSRHRQLAAELIDMVQRGAQGKQGDEVVDADVQVALGVLFNASEEYEKSQDCFRTALAVRPDDWMLWNRLGAVLANGNRPEEALGCYQEALRLYPGYIRAIFNIGIAYVKMSKYAQAGRYVVAALQMQHADASEGLTTKVRAGESSSSSAVGSDGYPITVDSGYPFRPTRQRNALPGGVRGLTSDTLWQSLRTVCVHMNRPELTSACDSRDLKAFEGVFDT